MKAAVAVILASLLAFPHCAARPARMQAPAASAARQATVTGPEVWRQVAERIPPGSAVRVEVSSGAKFRGVMMGIAGDRVMIKPRTRVPEPPREVPLASIELLELDQSGGASLGRAVALGVATGAGSFLALLLAFIASIDD